MVFFFSLIPYLTGGKNLKRPTQLGFLVYLAGQLLLLAIPVPGGAATTQTYLLLGVCLLLDAFGHRRHGQLVGPAEGPVVGQRGDECDASMADVQQQLRQLLRGSAVAGHDGVGLDAHDGAVEEHERASGLDDRSQIAGCE